VGTQAVALKVISSADGTLDKKIILKCADNGHGMSEEVCSKYSFRFLVQRKPAAVSV
jgi:hypothetical protein